MSEEKRRFSRIPFTVHATLTAGQTVVAAESLTNLSMGGCLFPLGSALAPGTDATLRIDLGGTANPLSIDIRAQVVRCQDGAAALRFLAIDPEGLFHLKNIVLYNHPDTERIEKEIHDHPGLV